MICPRSLWRWLWPQIIQNATNAYVEWFNNHRIRKQKNKLLPDRVSPQRVYDLPHLYGLQDLRIQIPKEAVMDLRKQIETPKEETLRWVSDEFHQIVVNIYERLGSPALHLNEGWKIFNAMIPEIRRIVMSMNIVL